MIPNSSPAFAIASLVSLIAAFYSLQSALYVSYRRPLRIAGIMVLVYLCAIYGVMALSEANIIAYDEWLTGGTPSVSGVIVLISLYVAELITCRRRNP